LDLPKDLLKRKPNTQPLLLLTVSKIVPEREKATKLKSTQNIPPAGQ
jgi:hypothetical protein